MKYYKGEATGNDFVLAWDPSNEYEVTPDFVREICDRHYGVGADGFIRVGRVNTELATKIEPKFAPEIGSYFQNSNEESMYFMDYYNADGTTAEMCGNGVRVTAELVRLNDPEAFADQECPFFTRAGIKPITLTYIDNKPLYSVDMGTYSVDENFEVTYFDKNGTKINSDATYINVGNPHIVCQLSSQKDLENIDLLKKPEAKPELPNDANYEFYVETELDNEITMRVYERGVGETYSCGTGATATGIKYSNDVKINLYQNILKNKPEQNLNIKLINDRAILIGPAEIHYTINNEI
ncbi:MAG: diaminopimelate epimerase [Bifidobacteriaceae bacterium]|jgi:diaminopimelate epimerase|nr:diaminopimelate epimerase [Bifidobacteriaceae bacterium]